MITTPIVLAGIRIVPAITPPQQQRLSSQLFGDRHQWGIKVEYAIPPRPGIFARARFIDGAPCALALRDSILL
jgi:glucose-1-phosphate thymidylyltransferase